MISYPGPTKRDGSFDNELYYSGGVKDVKKYLKNWKDGRQKIVELKDYIESVNILGGKLDSEILVDQLQEILDLV